MQSSFLSPRATTRQGDLALLHLSRDQQLPVQLSTIVSKAEDKGYAEGVVTNTRFGSFPHSTLIGVPWGSQVLASKVDTGSRGRGDRNQHRKRKADAISTDSPPDEAEDSGLKQATAATSGFIHVLKPTPESWTTSLPHRTQVVYTPDYSYILHRIRARPGSTLIEAGSGSGSFTHAAARAVFAGVVEKNASADVGKEIPTKGKVFTFEFHADRHQKVKKEMVEHQLDAVVTATHRDVYKDGFWLSTDSGQYLSPKANAVFLDLPAPWEALQHLTREEDAGKPSALDATSPVHICTFSPCIEQVQKTISEMRRQGWVEIDMVEIQHRRIEVKREYIGYRYEGMRGADPVAGNVDEALARLHQVEERAREQQTQGSQPAKAKKDTQGSTQYSAAQVYWDEGRLIHHSEPDLKTHTSYLLFAVLPLEWSEEDDAQVRAAMPQLTASSTRHQRSQEQNRDGKHKKLSNGHSDAIAPLPHNDDC